MKHIPHVQSNRKVTEQKQQLKKIQQTKENLMTGDQQSLSI